MMKTVNCLGKKVIEETYVNTFSIYSITKYQFSNLICVIELNLIFVHLGINEQYYNFKCLRGIHCYHSLLLTNTSLLKYLTPAGSSIKESVGVIRIRYPRKIHCAVSISPSAHFSPLQNWASPNVWLE